MSTCANMTNSGSFSLNLTVTFKFQNDVFVLSNALFPPSLTVPQAICVTPEAPKYAVLSIASLDWKGLF